MPGGLSNVSMYFTDDWLEDEKNDRHPLWVERKRVGTGSSTYLQTVESTLRRLESLRLPGGSKLRKHLKNGPQFFDTFAEIEVLLYLNDRELHPQWGKDPPDIVIPELSTDIEVKNLRLPGALTQPHDVAVRIDEPGRAHERFEGDREKRLARLGKDRVNIWVAFARCLDFEEWLEEYYYNNQWRVNLETGEVSQVLNGIVCDEKYAKVCAFVKADNSLESWLNGWPGKDGSPSDISFHGFLNPKRLRGVPPQVMDAFNISDPL